MQNKFLLTPFFLDEPSSELESLAQPGWRLNKPALPAGKLQQRLPVIHQPLADLVAEAISRGERPVSIAGDCCTAIGVLAGLQRAGLFPTLVWLDAHGDFNTWETTPSGFLGGMPLAMLVGRGEQTLVDAVGLKPIPEERVILCDGRDLDPGERQALGDSQVHHLVGIRSLRDHPLVAGPMYIHFDCDVVDPSDAPAMSYPAPGGPSAADLRSIFLHLAQRSEIAAVSMTTWTPELDGDGRSRAACLDLLHALIG